MTKEECTSKFCQMDDFGGCSCKEDTAPISMVRRSFMDAFGRPIPTFTHGFDTAAYLERQWKQWFKENVK